MANFKVGDICITVNSAHPAINNGVLMVIIGIDPNRTSFEGESTPYLIRRVDGQVMGSTTCRVTGRQNWGSCYEAHCAGYKLKRIDDQDGVDAVYAKVEVSA
ncbi:MAG: hypothetical protein KA207_02875 [Burkholderiaceae bacterium]|nr:hypothetical protein [Burkholderiaceae bacterium]